MLHPLHCPLLVAAGAALLFCPSFPAQSAGVDLVPSFGVAFNGFASAYSVDEGFTVAAQTSDFGPGIGFRFQEERGDPWTPVRRRFVDPGSSGLEPTVIVTEEDVFLCWVERTPTGTGGVRDAMFFDTSLDEGATWAGPGPMQPPGAGAVAVADLEVVNLKDDAGRNVVLVAVQWLRGDGASAGTLLFQSNDAGRTFSAPRPVRGTPDVVPGSLRVAAAGDRAQLAWVERDAAGASTVWARSMPLGAAPPQAARRLSAPGVSTVADGGLRLAAEDGAVVATWVEQDPSGLDALWLASSLDAGGAYRVPTLVTSATRLTPARPRLFPAYGSVVVAWNAVDGSSRPVGVAVVGLAVQQPLLERELFADADGTPLMHLGNAEGGSLLLVAETAAGSEVVTSPDGGLTWTASRILPGLGGRSVLGLRAAQADDDDRGHPISVVASGLRGEPASVHLVGFAGGERLRLAPDTVAQAGQPLQFELSGFGARGAGAVHHVLWSATAALTPLSPRGPVLGLGLDAWTVLSLELPQLGGRLDAAGAALTAPLLLPPQAGGLPLRVAGLAVSGSLGLAITPTLLLTIQP